jgi:hypothetical protein
MLADHMNDEDRAKVPLSVSSFPIDVLGGVFHVSELLLRAQEARRDVERILHTTPADRWFVMVSDHAGDAHDTLAMIDDNLEFQIYAYGVLRQE